MSIIKGSPKRQFASEEQKRNMIWNMDERGLTCDTRKSMFCQTSPQKNQTSSFVHAANIIETETKAIIDDNSFPQRDERELFQPTKKQINEGKFTSPIKFIQIQMTEPEKRSNIAEQSLILQRENFKKQISLYEQILKAKDAQIQQLKEQCEAKSLQNTKLVQQFRQKQNGIVFLGQELDRINGIIRVKVEEFQQEYQRSEQLIAMNRNKDAQIERLTQKINILQQSIDKMHQVPFHQNNKICQSRQISPMTETEILPKQQRKSSYNEQLDTFMGVNRVESIEQDDKLYTQALMVKIAQLQDRKIQLQIEVNRLKDIIDDYLQNNPQRQIRQQKQVLNQQDYNKEQNHLHINIPILSAISQKDSFFETESLRNKLIAMQEQRNNGLIIQEQLSQLRKKNQDLKFQLKLFLTAKEQVIQLSKQLDRVNHIAEELQQQNKYLNRQVQQNKWRKASMKSLKGNVEEYEDRLKLQSQQISRLNNLLEQLQKRSIQKVQPQQSNQQPEDVRIIEQFGLNKVPTRPQETISKQKYEDLMRKVIHLNQQLSNRQSQLFESKNQLLAQHRLETIMKNHFSAGMAVFTQLEALRSNLLINEHHNQS